jgi:hypothetical protein
VTKFHVTLEIKEGLPLGDAGLEALADALYELDASDPDLDDMDLTVSGAGGEFFAAMTVDAGEMPAALQKALITLRSAMHGIGQGTPGWEELTDSLAASIASAPQLVA